MSVITLTSDLGLKDHYVGAVKGAILSDLADAVIVDISHLVPPYNIQDAAYILKNAYRSFPPGSVHIISVRTVHARAGSHVIVKSEGHYFISADNGIFSLLLEQPAESVIALPGDSSTFPTRDVFAKAACHLIRGLPAEAIGQPAAGLLEKMPFRAASMGDMIQGSVIYIDSFGNIMTNISRELFDQVGRNRAFTIEFARYAIQRLSSSYSDVPEGEILALFNSSGQLEIAMNSDKAGSMLNIRHSDTITIRFQ